MEQQPLSVPAVSTRSVGMRYGVISGVIGVVYFLALTVSGVNITTGGWQWVGYLITGVILFLAHKHYKENGDGFMSYGQGIGIAFWQGLISSAISSVFTYIYIKFIDPTFTDMITEAQRQGMADQGMSEEQIDQAMQFASAFTTPEVMFVMGLVFGIIGTVIIGLILTIFTQKARPETTF